MSTAIKEYRKYLESFMTVYGSPTEQGLSSIQTKHGKKYPALPEKKLSEKPLKNSLIKSCFPIQLLFLS